MASLFLSYSHRDEDLRSQLETHLSGLQRQGFITIWHDRRITAGENFASAIDTNLEDAKIVLLLVSPDFIASDYCYKKEMTRALERHHEGGCVVIPVILRPCEWHDLPFGKLQATPKDGKPITLWANIDEAFLNVVRSIKAALAKMQTPRLTKQPSESNTVAAAMPGPRSSNLRVTKRFTEQDNDAFLHEAFEYMARFFEGSLEELHTRHQEIEGRFRRIDANRFTAVAYRDGKAVARCAVRLAGRFSHGISYSHDESASEGSYNENLSVKNDGQTLFLHPLGMSSLSGRDRHEEKLSMEGAAEFYWTLFIQPLQRD